MRRSFSVASVLACLVPATAGAQGSVEAGRETAATWCAPCHASPARTATSDIAPTFDWIVDNRSHEAIVGWLARPHGRMPDIQLSRQQIADVTRYMETLKRR